MRDFTRTPETCFDYDTYDIRSEGNEMCKQNDVDSVDICLSSCKHKFSSPKNYLYLRRDLRKSSRNSVKNNWSYKMDWPIIISLSVIAVFLLAFIIACITRLMLKCTSAEFKSKVSFDYATKLLWKMICFVQSWRWISLGRLFWLRELTAVLEKKLRGSWRGTVLEWLWLVERCQRRRKLEVCW